jgi:glycosyltransferase involved in cell wall biosynthesis
MDLTGSLHIGTLGTLSHMKGGSIVKMLCEHIDEQELDIPITVVGFSFSDIPPRINIHGSYTPNDLPIIVDKYGINVILMPSIIPETFSYTVSEAMEMGLPIVAFDIGAQGNRVKQYVLGKVVPLDSSPAVILAAIQSVLKIAQEKK